MKELVLKKCKKCGAFVEVIQDCTCENCGIKCCGEQMEIIKPNFSDLLNYEVVDNQIVVKFEFAMEDDNYIEWIAMYSDNKIGKKFLLPNEKAIVTFPYVKGSKIYAYCNNDELFVKDVE